MNLATKGLNLAAVTALAVPAALLFEAGEPGPMLRAFFYSAMFVGLAFVISAMKLLFQGRSDDAGLPLLGGAGFLVVAATLLGISLG